MTKDDDKYYKLFQLDWKWRPLDTKITLILFLVSILSFTFGSYTNRKYNSIESEEMQKLGISPYPVAIDVNADIEEKLKPERLNNQLQIEMSKHQTLDKLNYILFLTGGTSIFLLFIYIVCKFGIFGIWW